MKNKKENKISRIILTFEVILLIISIGYFAYSLLFIKTNQLFNIINSFLITFLVVMLLLKQITQKNIYQIVALTMIVACIGCNILNNFDVFSKKVELLGNFTNKSINEVLKWAEANNITIEQIYEYSDNIEEFNIISQDISFETPLNDVNSLKLIVSLGPNYDKIVIIPNLVGSNIDELVRIKNELFLNNIVINYIKSDEEKNIITAQSLKGQYARNTLITFTVSLGNDTISEIEMINLVNKDVFDATLWLKQNNINYEINYEFNDLKKNTVLKQSIEAPTIVSISTDKVVLTVSKGQSIIVPNILSMTSDEVINWISNNNLKIEFNEIYDLTAPLGSIISSNYKENDIIEDGTLIKITTSKGQITFPKVTSLQELKTWASGYNVEVNETYAMNNSIAKGEIISASYQVNDTVDPNKPISVVISTGKPITVPNFYNMSKNDIASSCSNLGLVCTFYESKYSNVAYNYALSQSVSAGSVVTSGKTISIGLSKGSPKTFTVKIPAATINSCIGDSNCTINSLKTYLSANYPGITFIYSTESSSTFNNAGFVHENSQVSDGGTITQGNTYKVIITK